MFLYPDIFFSAIETAIVVGDVAQLADCLPSIHETPRFDLSYCINQA